MMRRPEGTNGARLLTWQWLPDMPPNHYALCLIAVFMFGIGSGAAFHNSNPGPCVMFLFAALVMLAMCWTQGVDKRDGTC